MDSLLMGGGSSHWSLWRVGVGMGTVGLGTFALSATAPPALAEEAPAPAADASAMAVDQYARPNVTKGLPKEVILYQYEVCPFCCKVKAALDYYKIPYKVIEVNPLTKSEVKWSTYKKVPVLKMDEEVLVESTQIMSRIAAEAEAAAAKSAAAKKAAAAPNPATSSNAPIPEQPPAAKSSSWYSFGKAAPTPAPATGSAPHGQGSVTAPASYLPEATSSASTAGSDDELKWRKWVDDRFVKVITANIYRNWEESFESFRYITRHTNWSWGTREAARVSGAVIMWGVGRNLPKKYGIEGDLRQALYADCNKFVDDVGSRDFHGGSKPDLADLATFGVLRAVEGTPTFSDAMRESRIAPWYTRMQQQCPSARVLA